MIEKGIIQSLKYRLAGEVADQEYILTSIQKFKEADNAKRHRFLMKDIAAECKKRDAILAPGLLVFLKQRLNAQASESRKLSISCLSYMASTIDESRRTDLRLLRCLQNDFSSKLLEIAEKDFSSDVRIDAFRLLLVLGESGTISVIEHIVRDSAADTFRYFKSTLRNDLCRPYDESKFVKNRFLRDHKDILRARLTDIRVKSKDRRTEKRAEFLLRHLRNGPGSSMPSEAQASNESHLVRLV